MRLSVGTGLPSLLLYLGLGLLLGEDALGLEFDDAELAQALGYAALVVILAEGGLTTPWETHPAGGAGRGRRWPRSAPRCRSWSPAARRTLLLDVDWRDALLIGAVLAPTDSAAVFSVLRRVPLPPRLGGLLEAESGFNDAPVVILVVALAGTAIGAVVVGALAAARLRAGRSARSSGSRSGGRGAGAYAASRCPSSGLYPLAVLALCVTAYGAAAAAHASGFLAVYLAALVLGNARLPHRPATRGLRRGHGLAGADRAVRDARPARDPVGAGGPRSCRRSASGWCCCWWRGRCRCSCRCCRSSCVADPGTSRDPREQALLSWAGLRGAVPIVLATVPGDQDVFNLVFVLVVVFTLVQAPTLPWVARAARRGRRGRGAVAGHRVLAADPAGRRPAAGARAPTARGWPASRSSSSPADRCGRQPDRPRRARRSCPAEHPAAGGRRPDPGGHRVGAAGGRAPAAGGLPARPAGRLGHPAPPPRRP